MCEKGEKCRVHDTIMHKSDNQGRLKPLVSGLEWHILFFIDWLSNSFAITKYPALCASGGISK